MSSRSAADEIVKQLQKIGQQVQNKYEQDNRRDHAEYERDYIGAFFAESDLRAVAPVGRDVKMCRRGVALVGDLAKWRYILARFGCTQLVYAALGNGRGVVFVLFDASHSLSEHRARAQRGAHRGVFEKAKLGKWFETRPRDLPIVIASASPEFELQYAAKLLGVKMLIGTRCDAKTGRLIGKNCKGEEKLRRMGVALTLQCALSGVLALVLLHFGLVAEGMLAPIGVLDPVAAPAAFYAANLLFLAGTLAVAYPVLRDGLQGLRGRPSADTMPALAACGALLEAVVALLNAPHYQQSSFTLLSGIAALGLFLALLGSRVQLAAVKGGYDLAMSEPEHCGAYRVRDKDLIRLLSRSLDQKDPWVLLSRPTEWDETLVEQCFGERASERRARKTSLILLGVSVLAGVVFLLLGGGVSGGAAALTAVLCMGSPLSSTLVAGVASLRLQRTAAAAGAVVPGWAAIEELGLKDLTIAATSLGDAHDPIADYIEEGKVIGIQTSGIRGRMGEVVSAGKLKTPAIIRSHGGRPRAIEAGEVHIDIAFVAAPTSDCVGNCRGIGGKSNCGSMGYAMTDAKYADHVVVVTDCLVDFPNMPASVEAIDVDAVVVDTYGLPKGAYVESVEPGFAAEAAGLQPKDIIVGLGDESVTSFNSLARALRAFQAGDETTIRIYRSGSFHPLLQGGLLLPDRCRRPLSGSQPVPGEVYG